MEPSILKAMYNAIAPYQIHQNKKIYISNRLSIYCVKCITWGGLRFLKILKYFDQRIVGFNIVIKMNPLKQ